MISKGRTYIMGILNVTPDSFSDGGIYFDPEKAVNRGIELEVEGADIIDVGGESTRPGSTPVPIEEEIRRVIPVIKELSARVKVPISIDTYKAEVARLAIEAGASIVNDISAMRFDPAMVEVIREYKVPIVLMHMLGNPGTMQRNPVYNNVVKEVYDFLDERIRFAEKEEIEREKIIIDPGIGFGKKLIHNLLLIRNLHIFKKLGCPLLVGPSRKSFIGEVLNLPVEDRFEGTAAAVVVSIMKGADIVRVHDVKRIQRVVKIVESIEEMSVGYR